MIIAKRAVYVRIIPDVVIFHVIVVVKANNPADLLDLRVECYILENLVCLVREIQTIRCNL